MDGGGMTADHLPLDPGLLDRFRRAGASIAWRAAPTHRAKGTRGAGDAPGGVSRRVAHLNDEDATVERQGPDEALTLIVDSGPLGALVLLLEMDVRGLPNRLTTHEAGSKVGFAQGSLEASWGINGPEATLALPITDVIGLARYALA
jgi:hypothetical protein